MQKALAGKRCRELTAWCTVNIGYLWVLVTPYTPTVLYEICQCSKSWTRNLALGSITKLKITWQVPYVVLDSFQKLHVPWQQPKLSKNSAILQFGDTVATLAYSPFTFELKRGKEVLVAINSRSMFQFEQTRVKQVSSPASIIVQSLVLFKWYSWLRSEYL